nr:ATP-binding protein [Sneathiella limimaris]
MNAFAVDLISISDEKELAWYVAREVVSKLGFKDCVVYYCMENPSELVQMAAIGVKNPIGDLIVNHLKIPVGQGVTGRVAESQKAIVIDDLANCDFYIPDVEETKSEACVPILSEGRTLGVIDSEDPELGFYTKHHVQTLTFIASLMAAKLDLLRKGRNIREGELRRRKIFSVSLDGILTVSSQGNVVEYNKSVCDIFGYDEKELFDKNAIRILIPERLQKEYYELVGAMETTSSHPLLNTRFETTGQRKSGEEFPMELAITHYKVNGQGYFTGFLRDISEMKAAEVSRRNALMEAERANKTKSEFLATMSHELRTPLNAIIGFSEVIYGEIFGPLGSARYKEYAEDIQISGKHLLNLVNDILDLSAIEANEHVLNFKTVDLSEIMHDCSIIVSDLAAKKQITYSEDVASNLKPIEADPRSLSQILINLISNAIKFTQVGGEVSVKVWEEDGQQIVCVRDNGPGLAEDQIENLTKPFVRGQIDSQTTQEGSGLGLAIVNSLVQMHAGQLEIKSKLGEGTSVFVRLPRRQPEQQ